MPDTIQNVPPRTDRPAAAAAESGVTRAQRPSLPRLVLALVVVAVSDLVSWGTEFALPLQWVVDLLTAFLLFLILGRRWAILPGLVAEAIPGLAVFPVWVLVVMSIYLFDDIKARRTRAS
jgi:hypothetical protein